MTKDSKTTVKMPEGGIDKSSKGTGESMTKQTFKGGPSNIGHSIVGASARQGRSKGGKENGFD